MMAVLLGLLPCYGIFGCCQLFLVAFLSCPFVLYQGSLEGYVLGGCHVVDEWSGPLIFLSFWLGALMMVAAQGRESYCMWGVVVCCVMAFSSYNFFWFYIFFELTLIPVSLMILQWGSQPERVSSVAYMVLYTLGGSFAFLVFLVCCLLEYGSLFMGFSWDVLSDMGLLGFVAVAAFLVKLPVYPFHLWLTKAHVEAPAVGSMALAGLLLKLGGVGLMRVLLSYGQLSYGLTVFWGTLAMVGGVLTSLVCCRQSDMKALVAYSSVGHMSLVFMSVLSGSVVGWLGALFMMVSHGLSSSGLFGLLGEYYAKIQTRNVFVCSGIGVYYPGSSFYLGCLVVFSMGCPPGLGYLSEVLMGMGIVGSYPGFLVLFGFQGFLSGVYSLLLYVGIFHGSGTGSVQPSPSELTKTDILGFFHAVPLFLLFMFPFVI
uniref:NADH-ubiquinone oxidoreductase chain 4 n=1 Tax=Placopecten magellanicus TaxID=6577 RepID=Q4FE16_PLAMG|nr:NADH dehydrogenase subunit 4 [Placopecten magellanicus]AAZ06449.1 NADH dehydrogenase subunit 4 [Placopecten magellanicus]